MRLGEGDGRHAELPLQRPPDVARAHAELARQVRHAVSIERAGGDAQCRHPGELRHGVHQRASRRQLGTAPQAWPEPRLFGCGGGIEEAPARGIRHA